MAHPIVDQVRKAGVVGAGGAGFPTHVKLAAQVDTFLVNGVECEPLLHKDKELMRTEAGRLLEGLRLAMDATGATRGIIGVKGKHRDVVDLLEAQAMGSISVQRFQNFYPAGDEYQVVFECTGRLVPPGGLPLQVGCAVSNVETLLNVARAAHGEPVVDKALTVCGAVASPATFLVPVGTPVRDVLAAAGGTTEADVAVIDGGPMMGNVFPDLDAPVTKTTGGLLVLPRSHRLVRRKVAPMEVREKVGRSGCDQCMQCTELCPRFLLGYGLEPHKVMRSLSFAGRSDVLWGQWGLLCCECGACEYYICPEDLPPKSICVRAKTLWRESGEKPAPLPGLGRPHPMRDARKIPVERLVQRVGLTRWDVPAPLRPFPAEPRVVQLLLKQHVGVPAVPVAGLGTRVRRGEVVAAVPEGKLGVDVHASVDGKVARVDATSIWIERT